MLVQAAGQASAGALHARLSHLVVAPIGLTVLSSWPTTVRKEAPVLNGDDSATKLSHQCSVSVERFRDRLTLGLHGEFDLSCRETFQQAIAGASDDRLTELVVDLRGLSFIDSTGLNALLYLRERARSEERRVGKE